MDNSESAIFEGLCKNTQLVLRYALAAHHPVGIDEETTIITTIENEQFQTKGRVEIQSGWRKILKSQSDEAKNKSDPKLPKVNKILKVDVDSLEVTTGKTTPPKRLADSDLERAMENAGHILNDEQEDDEVVQTLKELGIGTPATRTHIIKELVHREYIEINKNLVYITNKGRHFIELVLDHPIASIQLTGEFEKKLNEVAEGKRTAKSMLDEFKQFSRDILKMKEVLQKNIQELHNDKPLFQKVENEIGDCPSCGKSIVERDKFYGCIGFREGCKLTLPKVYIKKNLTVNLVKQLLSGKEVLLENIQGKYGPFSLFIFLNNEGKIMTRKPVVDDLALGSCPLCSMPVLERDSFYGCSGFKEGCKFTLPKVFLSKNLTVAQIRKLLNRGRTDKIKGFQGRKGSFDAALGYNKNEKRLCFVN